MLGEQRAADLITKVLKFSRADQTEVVINSYDSWLTRFANSQIHQNVAEHNLGLSVRAVVGKRIGVATTNRLDRSSIREVVARACELARHQPEIPGFQSLPRVGSRGYRPVKTYYKRTQNCSARTRARWVKEVIELIRSHNLRAFGSFTTGVSELGIGNSLGTFAYIPATDAFLSVVAVGPDSSGYAQAGARDVGRLKPIELARRAAKKATLSQNPKGLKPGSYPVILEPLATAQLMEWLGMMGFNARAYLEGRSFMCERMESKVAADEVTLYDDAYDPRGFAVPFDFEGVPKQRVVLIDRGVAKGLVHDSLTASQLHTRSTGHALPAPNHYGPIPLNLVLCPGPEDPALIVRSTRQGVLVTRFHYLNPVDPKQTVITGMTRDGTFWVEDGEVRYGIKNLRFTQSILAALSQVRLGSDLTLVGGGAGYEARFAHGSLAPTMKVEEFNFTSQTEF